MVLGFFTSPKNFINIRCFLSPAPLWCEYNYCCCTGDINECSLLTAGRSKSWGKGRHNQIINMSISALTGKIHIYHHRAVEPLFTSCGFWDKTVGELLVWGSWRGPADHSWVQSVHQPVLFVPFYFLQHQPKASKSLFTITKSRCNGRRAGWAVTVPAEC